MADTSPKIALYIVDAFTSHPFKGNQAAICLVPNGFKIDYETKQKIAAEMNLSETAFIGLSGNNNSFTNAKSFDLQWFSPKCEVLLCGHATLASALVLFKCINNFNKTLEFSTLSGKLYVTKNEDFSLTMDFPQNITQVVENKDEISELIKSVIGDLPFEQISYDATLKTLVIQLKDYVKKEELETFKPSISRMLITCPTTLQIFGIIVTLKGVEKEIEYDFMSRYFAPWLGVDEDPVTGSAHTVLGPYWSNILKKDVLFARQCSPRGGEMTVKLKENERVELIGKAVVVLEGHLCI